MALLEKEVRETQFQGPPTAGPVRTTPATTTDPGRISRRTSFSLSVAWLATLAVSWVLEPAPAANEVVPWWAGVAALGFLGAIAATFAGLSRRMRWGVTASLIGSSIFLAGVFACPATGHHAFGLWWIGEFAASVALVGFSAATYLRRS